MRKEVENVADISDPNREKKVYEKMLFACSKFKSASAFHCLKGFRWNSSDNAFVGAIQKGKFSRTSSHDS